jgi:hypothetical protein
MVLEPVRKQNRRWCCRQASVMKNSPVVAQCAPLPFHSPVMRDKKKGSAPRHIPQTAARVVTRRGVAWCGEAGGGGGARVREPSSHTLLPQGEELTLYVGPTLSKLARWD